ncbi:MAG: bifunctional glutamate N-acetyltransferase/amino-acid acetyltransferase ArgJ [Candidatus Angelobacter sp. Gp1-AA117]|nr:MAG: bifunctional glutamate N-acetyltransferase/amino-acid acetyltransferase ArgJ [Candidatus Angelobacter sp. Gp1-AA117]
MIHLPRGFLFSACAAGLKASGKPDLAFVLAPEGASAAAVFTRNQVVAAPVTLGREHLRASHGKIHALIVNAGNANCATGAQGIKAAKTVCRAVASEISKIKARPQQVFPSSTGIIGVPLPVEKVTTALPGLIAVASPEAFIAFATAIMTTDTKAKIASEEFEFKGRKAGIVGVAKGAGMIHPNMATMLVYLFTDIEASPRDLQKILKDAVDQSFNNISIDGDTSTNDTVLLLASGKSNVQLKQVRKQFEGALRNVCRSLAQQIIADGEGVKHVVTLRIEQARSMEEARRIAGTIATSPLVKTAWAGADPNWGRILAAIGRSGVKVNPTKINIYLGNQQICKNGAAAKFDASKAHEYMSQPAYDIRIALGSGKTSLEFLSCDLTTEYVRINADYST